MGEDQCLSGDIVLLCVLSAFKKTDIEVIIRIRFFFSCFVYALSKEDVYAALTNSRDSVCTKVMIFRGKIESIPADLT